MKKTLLVTAVLAACTLPAFAHAQNASQPSNSSSSAAAQPYYSSEGSTIGDLIANPAAKSVLQKYIPTVVNNPQIDQASGMTLKAVQSYAPDQLTDEVLAKIDSELKSIPAPKS